MTHQVLPSRVRAVFFLLLLLGGTQFLAGCRAFSPEAVVVNRLPDTFIIGAPAETTGTRFLRHLFWYGSDDDGDVVRYIWAATDSVVFDDPRTQELDEENGLFDPADDILTLEEKDWRRVGFTTKTDSIFLFTVDRGPTTSKSMAFHLAAVDDRGGIDPTPARLHFFNNSLGNPNFVFRFFTDVGGSWQLRWVGNVKGPFASSPEQTSQPFTGYGKPFRVEWEASSPNGLVTGYRYKATQGTSSLFTPAQIGEDKAWDSSLTSFVFDNATPAADLPGCDGGTLSGCDPAVVRWPSGEFRINVEAIDVALVETVPDNGELRFQVNYPPRTTFASGGGYPYYLIDDGIGGFDQISIAEGDTIPVHVQVYFRTAGEDRLVGNGLADGDSLCCDLRLDPLVPEIRHQAQLQLFSDASPIAAGQTLFSPPIEADTVSFYTQPFRYKFRGRVVDEHRRADPIPVDFDLRAGFNPQVLDIFPGDGDTLVLRSPNSFGNWPENDVPYTIQTNVTRYWDGIQFLNFQAGGAEATSGSIYRFKLRFEGAPDPRDPNAAVKAWSYSYSSINNPSNNIDEGPLDSKDLRVFSNSPLPNLWEFRTEEEVELFVPSIFWSAPQLYEPNGSQPFVNQGVWLRQRLGVISLRARGRTTANAERYRLPADVRKNGPNGVEEIRMENFGRLAPVRAETFEFYLGLGSGTQPTTYWPDF